MIARDLPLHCSWNTDRHGRRRVRFRKGEFTSYISGIPYSATFMIAYHALLAGETKRLDDLKATRTAPGTIDAVIVSFYGSPDYRGLKLSTRKVRRRLLERFREEHGQKRVAMLTPAHIKSMMGNMANHPEAANNFLKALRVLLGHAVDMGVIDDNPARNVRQYKSNSEGHHCWTEAEVEAFEARHKAGSKAHLALSLLLYTGQRRSDVIRMGWQHFSSNLLTVVQDKTGASLKIPFHPRLAALLEAMPRKNMTFLLTEAGAPFSPAGFGNWFRDRCNEAGLPHCSAHGLRKACATRLANAGCTPEQIKSITGHKTLSEVARYTKAADQERNAKTALANLLRSEGEL